MRSVAQFSFLFVGLMVAGGKAQVPTPPPLFTPGTPTTTAPATDLPAPTTPDSNDVVLAVECDEELCKLPDCRCSSTDIPGDLSPRDTPQFVTVTFDDAINVVNIETYRNILYNRVNSDSCPAGATFYVSHEYTNYRLVNELYNRGFEIALNSISHRTPQTYWASASYNVIKEEIADQVAQISHFANIPSTAIKGVRLPFLQMSGDTSFRVMADYGLQYDNSWPTTSFRDPGLWPYTLDYASTQDCIVPPCPTGSIQKPWVMPLISWTDNTGLPCVIADSCFFAPQLNDEEGWFKFIVTNFERHYFGNRAPFGLRFTEGLLAGNPAVRTAFVRALDMISQLNDAFLVNSNEVIDWVKNPIPVDEYKAKPCRQWSTMACSLQNCGPLVAPHNQMSYWMEICNVCPLFYPWTGNPLGL